MRLYHATLADLASRILEEGFEDGPQDSLHPGVPPGLVGTFFGDRHVEGQDSMGNEWTTLVVDVPDEVALHHELFRHSPGDEEASFREFLLPAEVANRYPVAVA